VTSRRSVPDAAERLEVTAPPGGWDDFVARQFRRAPRHWPASAGALADEGELFELIVRAADAQRAGAGAALRLYVDRSLRIADAGELTPAAGDGSLARWLDRAEPEISGRDVGLVLNDAQEHSFALFLRVRRFLGGLVGRVGLSARNDAVVFATRSRATPFGLHADPYDNFLFFAAGKKTMHVFPPDTFTRHPEARQTTRYRPLLGEALTIEARPGDLLYIPAGHPHVAESDHSLAVHLSVIAGADADAWQELVAGEHANLVRAHLPARPLAANAPCNTETPEPLAQIVGAHTAVASELGPAVDRAWLLRLSALGFSRVPALAAAAPLGDDDVICADAAEPVLVRAFGDEVLCAAFGHAAAFPAHPGALRMVERINLGQPLRVGALIRVHAGHEAGPGVEFEADPDGLRAVLEQLLRMRAVRRL
jgi:mannose-6-phosphate isomerase-like protein (cupin superfamily)